MAEIILEKTALQNAKSRAFRLSKADLPATLQIFDGTGSASAKIQRSYDGSETDATFEDYYIEGSIKTVTEADTNMTAIDAPGVYRVVKTTSGDGGVSLSTSTQTPGP